mgnify:CR=1 FL=1
MRFCDIRDTGRNDMKEKTEYQLREAAGVFWLLHMTQTGFPFEKPLVMNACGALIWDCYAKGYPVDKISHIVQETYDIPEKQAKEDTQEFIRQLEEHMA